MYAFSGLFSRDVAPPAAINSNRMKAYAPAKAAPVDHVVMKDGKPFAILNATPELATRTLSSFVRATPESCWTLSRC